MSILRNIPSGGPNISSVPLRADKFGLSQRFLSVEDRHKLALIASLRHFNAGELICNEDDQATFIFNIASGVAKSYSFLPEGKEIIQGFFFANDLLGFMENGRYTNTVKAITPVVAFQFHVSALEALLRTEPDLQLQFLAKTCHELRLAQQHAIALSQQSAQKRLLMLLNLVRLHNEPQAQAARQIHLPMSRADIADYTGLAVETVSRNLHQLQRQGVIHLISPQCIEIADEHIFTAALAQES
jgi:CRP-like cAMP-binding protein